MSNNALFVICAFALMGGALAAPPPVNCTAPVEGLNIVATYDNSAGDQEHTFHYNEKLGTHFEEHGHPGEEELEGFFAAFAEILGVSEETGMDWTALSDVERAPESHRKNDIQVAAFTTVVVKQVQGFCDGGTIFTEDLIVEEV